MKDKLIKNKKGSILSFDHQVGSGGFSLIEILTVLSVFSVVVILVSGIFFTNLRTQQRSHATQKTLGEISYAIEYINRLARMARSDRSGECTGSEDHTYTETNLGNGGFRFIDYHNRCVEFYREGGALHVKARPRILGEEGFEDNAVLEGPLTSSSIEITEFAVEFKVEEDDDLHRLQPTVTVYFSVEERMTNWFTIEIQSTVTRRNPDIAY